MHPLFDTTPQPLIPPRWARGGHRQTILGHLWPSPPAPSPTEQWQIPLSDGDKLVALAHLRDAGFAVCLFHGLGGSSDSDYMRRLARVCESLEVSCVRVNHRGCGPGEGLATGPYHSGRGDDISAALHHIRGRLPNAFLLAIGFSLSGNALLLSLAGVRGTPAADAAIAVNAPIDLEDASRLMGVGWNRLYDFRFVRLCRDSVKSRVRAGRIVAVDGLSPWSKLRDFDALYTAPAGGFESREHYYATCSAGPHLAGIRTPTLLLTSKDDPFVDARNYQQLKLPPNVRLHLEPHGGHMGYLSSLNGENRRWMDGALRMWIAQCRSRVSA